MAEKEKKLFCDINPFCYELSLKKEILKRHIKNMLSKEKFAKTKLKEPLPHLIAEFNNNMIKRAPGVELDLQFNKAKNIDISCKKINGIIIRPGEVFSFWGLVGKITKRKGYKEGRVIRNNRLIAGIGGGLCNLSNTIHRMVLLSPMDVLEFHKHSDALAPDEGKRVPFSAGTTVCYNNVDYRFKNNTDQNVQLLLWCVGETLHAQLRSERPYPRTYEIFEEDHHFKKEGDKFFRNSKIYRNIKDAKTGELLGKELILDNHSEVMFDYSLIPEELIRDM